MFACAFPVSAQEESKSKLTISDEVPEGFASLMEAQTLVINVRYNDSLVGNALVTADTETLTFEEPDKLVDSLTGISNPERLKSLLTKTFPINAHLVCFAKNQPKGCGKITPEPVAIIYNSNLLTIDLFLDGSLQTVQSRDAARFLPPPEDRNTAILSLDLLTSDTSDGEHSLDLASRSLNSYGAGNVLTELDFNTRTGQSRLRTARLQHLYNEQALSVGTFSFETGATIGNLDIIGASFESSLSTRVDLEDAFSSELAVSLPRRSQVLLIVNNRAFLSESYPAGNQALNTRPLPNGTYEVTIRIADPVTGFREETRLFTKNTSMPPRGETVFGLTFGTHADFEDNDTIPQFSEVSLGGMHVAKRLSDQSAWRLGVIGLNSVALTEAQYLLLSPRLSFQFSLAAGSDNINAGTIRLGYVSPLLSLNLNANWFDSDDIIQRDPSLDGVLPETFTQYTGSWTRTFGKTSINARFSKRIVGATPAERKSVEDFTVDIKHLLYSLGKFRVNLDLQYEKENTGEIFSIGISASSSENIRASSDFGILSRKTVADENPDFLTYITHNVRSHEDNPLIWDADIRGEMEEKTEALGINAEIEHRNYLAALNVDWNSIEADQSVRSSAFRISTHLGVDSRGFAMGGTDVGQSGVIIHLKGPPSEEVFDIYINRVKAAFTKTGNIRFVGLPPLREYHIKIVPRQSITTSLSEDEFRFSAFPGAVYRITTDIIFKVLLIASIEDENGEPVTNGFIPRDVEPALVDPDGFVQIEASPGERLTVVRTGMPDCLFIVPQANAEEEEMLVPNDPLTCRTVK